MEYGLAKKLKDAGFPQFHLHDERLVYLRDVLLPFGKARQGQLENGQVVDYREYITVVPTLSELIEACGDSIHSLVRLSDMNAWDAVHILGRSMRGTTPEEAVAHLWLALNKK